MSNPRLKALLAALLLLAPPIGGCDVLSPAVQESQPEAASWKLFPLDAPGWINSLIFDADARPVAVLMEGKTITSSLVRWSDTNGWEALDGPADDEGPVKLWVPPDMHVAVGTPIAIGTSSILRQNPDLSGWTPVTPFLPEVQKGLSTPRGTVFVETHGESGGLKRLAAGSQTWETLTIPEHSTSPGVAGGRANWLFDAADTFYYGTVSHLFMAKVGETALQPIVSMEDFSLEFRMNGLYLFAVTPEGDALLLLRTRNQVLQQIFRVKAGSRTPELLYEVPAAYKALDDLKLGDGGYVYATAQTGARQPRDILEGVPGTTLMRKIATHTSLTHMLSVGPQNVLYEYLPPSGKVNRLVR